MRSCRRSITGSWIFVQARCKVSKLFREPEELKVKTDAEGMPVNIIRDKRVERVLKVYKRWRISDKWWQREVSREYFTIETAGGLVCDIYRDMMTKRWFLSRIYD